MTRSVVALGWCLLSIMMIGGASFQSTTSGQSTPSPKSRRAPTEKEIDNDLKTLLSDYYLGKPVRAKITIPANETGIEVIDGQLNIHPLADIVSAVHPGDLVSIKEMRFKERSIEVLFNYEPTEKKSDVPAMTPVGSYGSDVKVPPSARSKASARKPQPDPRVILRYSRAIGTADLNLQNINRLLSPAIDTSTLNPKNSLPASDPEPARQSAALNKQEEAARKGIPIAPVTGSLVTAQPNIGEIVVECQIPGARLYVDGAYSGTTPRTLQLLTGIHTVLILTPGYQQWELRFFLVAGKISRLKADLIPVK